MLGELQKLETRMKFGRAGPRSRKRSSVKRRGQNPKNTAPRGKQGRKVRHTGESEKRRWESLIESHQKGEGD